MSEYPDFSKFMFPDHMYDVYQVLVKRKVLQTLLESDNITYDHWDFMYKDLKLEYSNFQLEYILNEIRTFFVES